MIFHAKFQPSKRSLAMYFKNNYQFFFLFFLSHTEQALRHPYFTRLPPHQKLHDKSNDNSMSSSPESSPHSLSR